MSQGCKILIQRVNRKGIRFRNVTPSSIFPLTSDLGHNFAINYNYSNYSHTYQCSIHNVVIVHIYAINVIIII
jgi:hypothetical protein